jgi:adenosylcobinamide amidohydrolase
MTKALSYIKALGHSATVEVSTMNRPFIVRLEQDALIVSFPAPARVLSWAIVNGGYRRADHVINHHVSGSDRGFCAKPARWLEEAVSRLGLQGAVVATATAVEMKTLTEVSLSGDGSSATCFATVGCGNALSVGDPASATVERTALSPLHTINMILVIQPGISDEALVEAVQVATEGRVRALYEAGIQSSLTDLPATGTGTDCIAAVSLGGGRARYCGKHTRLGELIGRAAYAAVKSGLALTEGGAAQGRKHNA